MDRQCGTCRSRYMRTWHREALMPHTCNDEDSVNFATQRDTDDPACDYWQPKEKEKGDERERHRD